MKHFIALITSFLFFNLCAAQNILPLDTVFEKTDRTKYFILNNNTYQLLYQNLKYSFIKNDTIILMKNIHSFSIHTFQYNENLNSLTIFASANPDNRLIELDFVKDELILGKVFKDKALYSLFKNKVYYEDKYSGDFSIEDINTHAIKTFDFNKVLNTKGLRIFEVVKVNDKSFLVNLGYQYGDEYNSKGYYIFQEPELTYSELIPNKQLEPFFINEYGYGINVNYYSLDKKYVFLRDVIIDSNYNYFSGALMLSYNVNGLVIQNNKVKQIMVASSIDTPDRFGSYPSVLVQYNACPYKEKAMYEIFNNKFLIKEDLQRFSAFDLRLLRNMIFAKHNYAFEDEFLTAYFNLYNFYQYEKKKRTKNVNDKLTKADKANLELIRSMEKLKETK